jgi:hypothetical protein
VTAPIVTTATVAAMSAVVRVMTVMVMAPAKVRRVTTEVGIADDRFGNHGRLDNHLLGNRFGLDHLFGSRRFDLDGFVRITFDIHPNAVVVATVMSVMTMMAMTVMAVTTMAAATSLGLHGRRAHHQGDCDQQTGERQEFSKTGHGSFLLGIKFR